MSLLARIQHHSDETAARRYHDVVDRHRSRSRLSDVVLGGQDGLVNALGVLLGVAAASRSSRLVLAAGLATAFAEALSMAAVAYTSRLTDGALYASERERELRHIEAVPELEREEVRALYRSRGIEGELLERIVTTLTADPEVWVAVMMTEEHHLAPVHRLDALRAASIVGLSSLVGALLPLLPFGAMAVRAASAASIVLSAVTLFGLGAYKARVTVGSPMKSGLEIALIGLLSAAIGYLIGALFGSSA